MSVLVKWPVGVLQALPYPVAYRQRVAHGFALGPVAEDILELGTLKPWIVAQERLHGFPIARAERERHAVEVLPVRVQVFDENRVAFVGGVLPHGLVFHRGASFPKCIQ